MSLQGTLDTFALADVIRLLSATSKTGLLRVDGPDRTGGVWLDAGSIVGVDAPSGGPASAAVATFELLRLTEGTFAFDGGVECEAPDETIEVESLLAEAEELLGEWQEIAAVVPSLQHRVSLTRTLPAEAVEVSQEQWSALVAIGGGASVAEVGGALEQGELDVSRTVRALVEAGLVVVTEPAEVVEPEPEALIVVEPEPEVEVVEDLPWVRDALDAEEHVAEPEVEVAELAPIVADEPTWDDEPFGLESVEAASESDHAHVEPDGDTTDEVVEEVAVAEQEPEPVVPAGPRPTWSSLYPQHNPIPAAPAPATLAEAIDVPVPEDPALLQQLSGLRPTEVEDEVDPDDEATETTGEAETTPGFGDHPLPTPVDPTNRGALMKFLSSVRT